MVVVQVMFDRWESEKSEISRGMLCEVVSSCMQEPSKIMHIGTNPLHLGAAMGPWAQKPHDPGEISGFSCHRLGQDAMNHDNTWICYDMLCTNCISRNILDWPCDYLPIAFFCYMAMEIWSDDFQK